MIRTTTLTMIFLLASCASRPRPGDEAPHCSDAESAGGKEVSAALRDCCRLNRGDRLDVLVLSGGGSHGAWGVGVMTGWREAKKGPKRPDFKIVTGVSTGALMAPFLFLNDPAEEARAERLYTTISNHDVHRRRFLPFVPFSNSFHVQKPLWKMLRRELSDAFIDRVRAESDGGRRLLLVGTVNLDSGKTRVWNLSQIAASDSPDRYDCFRKVIFASASMPVISAPVFIDGAMHVDGGAREQLFLRNVLGPVFDEAQSRSSGAQRSRPAIYVIVNGHLDGVVARETKNRIASILGRTIEVMLAENKVGNLLRVAETARELHADLFVSAVPETTPLRDSYEFEPQVMTALLEEGRAFGRANRWGETMARLEGVRDHAVEGPDSE